MAGGDISMLGNLLVEEIAVLVVGEMERVRLALPSSRAVATVAAVD